MAWAEGIYFTSGDFVLDIPRIDFPEEGITCIWGKSGSGKTTLLHCLAGLIPQNRLRFSVGGELISEIPPANRNVGFVFQDFLLFPHMSVYENIKFAAVAKKLLPELWEPVADELILRLGLTEKLHQKAFSLSGGEQQRVALARALVTKPRLVLLDEPLSSLDEQLKDEARLLIADLSLRFKVPFVMVTHDLKDVRFLSKHLIVISDGVCCGSGKTSDLLDDPASIHLARLVPENQEFSLEKKDREGWFLSGLKLPSLIEKIDSSLAVERLVTKKWGFQIPAAGAAQENLNATLLEIRDLGYTRSCLIQFSDGQRGVAYSHRSMADLKLGSNVSLTLDPKSSIVFKN